MKHHLSAPTSGMTPGSARSFGSKATIVGVAVAMIAGSALLTSGAAIAAPAFAVTTPADGATGVQQTLPNVVPFAGTGLPVADYASVSYLDAAGTVRNATFGGSTNDGTGNWTGNENFGQLSTGQTTVVATVSALDNQTGAADTTVAPVTVTFTLAVAPNPANPFTVTSPVSNSPTPVASTTPTFTGTGNPGATIKITYGARAGATGTAATVVVDATGNWTTPTDFSLLEPGATDGSAIVTEYGTDGNVFPGTGGLRINFTFPSAPAPLIPLVLVTDPQSSTLTSATTTGVAFGATGFSPDEQLTVVVTDPSGAPVVLPVAGDFFASTTDGSFIGVVLLPDASSTGTYTITVTGVRSERTVSGTFAVTADPVTPPTGTFPVVSG